MSNTTFQGPVRSQNGFQAISVNSTTGAVTTNATFGTTTNVTTLNATDVVATNVTVTTLEFTGAATAASNAAAFTADFVLEINADGTTYYVPAAAAAW